MFHKLLSRVGLLGVLSPQADCSFNLEVSPSSAVRSNEETIVLTNINFDPESQIRKFQPVAKYLRLSRHDRDGALGSHPYPTVVERRRLFLKGVQLQDSFKRLQTHLSAQQAQAS